MSVNLLVHVEQYDVLGILPSQLESLALLTSALGVGRAAFVDGTADGVRRAFGFERYGRLGEWLVGAEGRIVALDPDADLDIRDVTPQDGDWYVFGPAMGFPPESFGGRDVTWARVPVGVLNSRDAVPIVMWEVSPWRAR